MPVRVANRAVSVAVVDGHEMVGLGAAEVLRDDRAGRFRVTGVVRRIADLTPARSGICYDVCVLGLTGVGTADEITGLLASRPVVVCARCQDWHPWVAAWALGARAVVGDDQGLALADAVHDAQTWPSDVGPQLARALLLAAEAGALRLAGRHGEILEMLAVGLPRDGAMEKAELDASGYARELDCLRRQCVADNLARLELPGAEVPRDRAKADWRAKWPPRDKRDVSPAERRALELTADGHTIEEIAAEIGRSEQTVRNQIASALRRYEIYRTDAETRLWFALAVTGRHRYPDRLLRRLQKLQNER